MILSPKNVELTKVHYYESFRKCRNVVQSEIFENNANNVRKKLLSRKLILNIANGTENSKRQRISDKIRVFVVLFMIAVLITSALLIFTQKQQRVPKVHTKQTKIITIYEKDSAEATLEVLRGQFGRKACSCLNASDVCLFVPKKGPQCHESKDLRDPTGCGGLCPMNTHHCRLLDKRAQLYECISNKELLKCPKDYFSCGNAFCVHKSRLCDGLIDCPDLSDEQICSKECNLKDNFLCGNGTSCLPLSKRCNGRVDCWDNSDELDCQKKCATGSSPCKNGYECFPFNKLCDGFADCSDASDELAECFGNHQ